MTAAMPPIVSERRPADDDTGLGFQLAYARDRLRELRELQDITQTEVARRMGATPSAVSRLEAAARPPEPATLARYADAVGARVHHTVTVSWDGRPGR